MSLLASLRGLLAGVVAAAMLAACTADGARDGAGEDAAVPSAPLSGATASGDTPTSTLSGTLTSSTTSTPTSTPSPAPSPTVKPRPAAIELPRGGRRLFPTYRLVGYSGAPGAEALGRLGVGDLDARAAEIERRLAPYAADGRQLMPVLELITTIALATPGPGGLYRARQSDEVIARYLAAARRVDGLLLLNIQPGRAEFIDEVRAYRDWLRQPDVGLALDPEWAIGPGEVPGRVYGRVTGAELDEVGAYVARIVKAGRLPDKALVFHQVAPSVVRGLSDLRRRAGIEWIRSVDGIGARQDKEATWERLVANSPAFVHAGFKLFYVEDARLGPLMTPAQVMALRPRPEYVLYE